MTYEKIVVTGGAGLLGRHVVKEMATHAQITTLDIKEPEVVSQVAQNHLNVSITNYEEIKKAFMGYDAVIHLAAIPNPREADAKTTFDNNVQGAWTVLQAAEDAGIKRVIVASSDLFSDYHIIHPIGPPSFCRWMKHIQPVQPKCIPYQKKLLKLFQEVLLPEEIRKSWLFVHAILSFPEGTVN